MKMEHTHLLLVLCCCSVRQAVSQFFPLPFSPPIRTCRDPDIKLQNIEVTDMSHRYIFRNNAAFVDLTWNLYNPDDQSLDGFAVYFVVDNSSNVISQPPVSSCYSGFDHMWVRTNDTTACDSARNVADCNEEVDLSADDCLCNEPNCSLFYPLAKKCRGTLDLFSSTLITKISFSVPITMRKLRFQIEFSTKYNYEIQPYYRQYAHFNADFQKDVPYMDECVSLITGENSDSMMSFDEAQQFCCEKGALSILVRNVTFGEPIPDFAHDTYNITVSWLPPGSDLHLDEYSYMTTGKFAASYTTIRKIELGNYIPSNNTSDNCTYNPRYRYELTVYDLKLVYNYTARISPQFSDTKFKSICRDGRCVKKEKFATLEFRRCDPKYNFCDPLADCRYANESQQSAYCTCRKGYVGSGDHRDQGGDGCQDEDGCKAEVTGCATVGGNCTDLAAPEVGVKCSCVEGFIGDGYENGSSCRSVAILALSIALPLVILFLIVLLLVVLVIRRRRRRRREAMLSAFVVPSAKSIINRYFSDDSSEIKLFEPTFGETWEIERSRIQLKKVIGRGNYGVVHLGFLANNKDGNEIDETKNGSYHNGTLYNPIYSNVEKNDSPQIIQYNDTQVAVKELLECSNYGENLANFLAEIGSMLSIGEHENIVRVYGCCTVEEPVYLITEYLPYGDLLHFLWDARELTNREKDPIYKLTESSLCSMALHVARGLEYLTNIRIIHGDIAARNILVGEGGVCKISDFGLANDVYRYGMIKGHGERMVPYKWISPERLMSGEMPITYKSDVWSFGNLMYEMFTLGCSPHPGIETDELLDKLRSGYRMKQPATCNNHIYDIMVKCWRWRASARPSFEYLVKSLEIEQERCTYKDIAADVEALDKEKYINEINLKNGKIDQANGNVSAAETGQTTV